MLLFLSLFSCSQEDSASKDSPLGSTQTTQQETPSQVTPGRTRNEPVIGTEGETMTATAVQTQTETQVKATKMEDIPTPNIDGLASNEQEPIRAEEIQAHLNKSVEEEAVTEAPLIPKEETPPAEIKSLKFNETNGEIILRVYKDDSTLGAGFAHNHIILARSWEGQLIWNPDEPHNCLFSFRVPTRYLEVDPDQLRQRYKMEGTISKKDRKTIKKHMLDKSQLWSSKFPYVTFHASLCEQTDDALIAKGTLEIRGKTRKFAPKLTLKTKDTFSIDTRFSIRQTDYGFEPYSGLMGAVKNKDNVDIIVSIQE